MTVTRDFVGSPDARLEDVANPSILWPLNGFLQQMGARDSILVIKLGGMCCTLKWGQLLWGSSVGISNHAHRKNNA